MIMEKSHRSHDPLQVFCGRYVNKHMVYHTRETNHSMVLSFSDLSVWCYSCDSYVHNRVSVCVCSVVCVCVVYCIQLLMGIGMVPRAQSTTCTINVTGHFTSYCFEGHEKTNIIILVYSEG